MTTVRDKQHRQGDKVPEAKRWYGLGMHSILKPNYALDLHSA